MSVACEACGTPLDDGAPACPRCLAPRGGVEGGGALASAASVLSLELDIGHPPEKPKAAPKPAAAPAAAPQAPAKAAPAPAPAPAKRAPAGAPAPSYGEERGLGGAFDDDFGGGMPLPELDMPTEAAAPDLPMPDMPLPPPPSAGRASAPGADPGPAAAASATTKVTTPADEEAALREEARIRADFGVAPTSLVACVPYAIRVVTRKRELISELAASRRRVQQAMADSAQADAALGELIVGRSLQVDVGPLKPLVERAGVAMRASGNSSQVHDEAKSTAQAKVADVDQRIAQAQAAVNPIRDRETKIAAALAVKEGELKRVQARLQRVMIELRALSNASGGADPSKIAMLEADREARRAEVAAAERPVQELTAQLGKLHRELAVALGAVSQAEDAKKKAESDFQRAQGAAAAALSEADRERQRALAELGSEARKRKMDLGLGGDVARAAADKASALSRVEHETLVLEEAGKSFEKRALQRGLAVLAGTSALVLAALIALIVR